MSDRVSDGRDMVRQMSPRLVPGRFVFLTVTDAAEGARLLPRARAMFREDEGLSLILDAVDGAGDWSEGGAGETYRQITLDVHSALDGVGLTAAVSAELAAHNIPSNVVAANHHDHIFVPEQMAEAALGALARLSRGAGTGQPKE